MSKNLIPVIAKELGVEIGEEFKLTNSKNKYRFADDMLEFAFKDDFWVRSDLGLNRLIDGEIIKLPYAPKIGEGYWTYVNENWEIDKWTWVGESIDYITKGAGCVFRTKEEAINARPEVYKRLTGKEWKENVGN